LGNGLSSKRTYNPYTQHLDIGQVKTTSDAARVQESYDYDELGNVKQRALFWTGAGDGFVEDYTYDNLNRLETATNPAVPATKQTYVYDATGNILSKTNVSAGLYSYPAQGAGSVRPHAVTSIPGIGSFSYDDNGNLTSGAGRTLTWKSFDMPERISKGSNYSDFVYGSEHQRTLQVRSDGTRFIYAGMQEVESKNGVDTLKTYWPSGLGLETDQPNKTTELLWTHQDRLGSIVALTDSQGNLKDKLAFDSWGKRFNLIGTATPDDLKGAIDTKGYTGHEMLDELDLVHMNGRVYDPLVAKFVSADPILQDPMNGQSYNRFAYVLNNPTNLTDPTGFSACVPSEKNAEMCQTKVTESQDGTKVTITAQKGTSASVSPSIVLPGRGESKTSVNNRVDSKNNPSYSDQTYKPISCGMGHSGEICRMQQFQMTPEKAQMALDLGKTVIGFDDITDAIDDYNKGHYFAAVGSTVMLLPVFRLRKLSKLKKLIGCKCFVAGTLIYTQRGLVPIEKIQVGDWVAARSDETSETAYKQVVRLVRDGEKEIIRLRYRLPNGKVEILGVTEEHPFMLEGRRWVNAGALKPGDKIMRLAGGVLTVVSMRHQVIKHHTYNFEVEGFHTYFAGVGGAWVHNSGGPCDLLVRFHHAYPQYLGGKFQQLLEPLPKAMHDAFHSGLDKVLPRQIRGGATVYYESLSAAEKAANMKKFEKFTKDFDKTNGTHLWEAAIREGVLGK
jgi:RHS repeat-associated protein